jgi:tetratricopeptide (TPR) repeat protein
MTHRIATIITLIGIAAGASRPVAAQDSLTAAKDLYAAAAYEDALKVLGRIENPLEKVENAPYQVFCLIALDRRTEAEGVIERMLEADPLYAPATEEASPRVRETFERVRARITPRLVPVLYAEAKAALERKEHDSALKKFELLLKIIERAGDAEDTLLGEFKLLAGGFVDLARARVAAEAQAAAASDPVPAPAAPAAPADLTAAVTPAVPIQESFPPWNPGGFGGRGYEFKGIIRLRISAAGRVESAEIVESIHPAYDPRLLVAAASWTYEPARRGGAPIPSERVVAVRLKQD